MNAHDARIKRIMYGLKEMEREMDGPWWRVKRWRRRWSRLVKAW